MRLTYLNLTEDIQEIDKLLAEGVITEGFADVAKQAMAKGGELLKNLHAKGTVTSVELLKKLNSPVGKIALIFAVGALGNVAMGAEDFVSNLSQMDGFDSAVDAIQDINQDTNVFDDQSVDALDSDGGADGADGLEHDELAELKAEVEELKTEQPKIINGLRTVARGDTSSVAVDNHLDKALNHIMDSDSKADVIDNITQSSKYLKKFFDTGDALDNALLHLKKAAVIKIKMF